MARYRRAMGGPRAGGESFIDVLSNTVGGLALLCILASLDAGNLRWRLFITEEKAADTEPVNFVVQHGQIKPLDFRRLTELTRPLSPGEHEIKASSEFPFDLFVTRSSAGRADYELRNPDQPGGDLIDDFLRQQGAIFDQLEGLNPEQDHVYLYLAADGFADYMRIRDCCHELGLKIGWQPKDGPLRFSSGGGDATGGRPVGGTIDD